MPYARPNVAFIRVSQAVADRLKAAPVTMKLRGQGARIDAADQLLTDAMNRVGVPTFDVPQEAISASASVGN